MIGGWKTRRKSEGWKVGFGLFLFLTVVNVAAAQWLLIPMDMGKQTNHLKAYGLTYWALEVPREYRCFWVVELPRGCVCATRLA